jgi:integrase
MKARTIERGSREASSPLTVREALDTYEAYLRTLGDNTSNITRLRGLLSFALLDRVVALLTPRELRRWRDRLTHPLAPASVNKTMTTLKAALNFAVERDERVANRRAWQNGLASIRDAKKRRNVVLPDLAVRQIIAAAYEQNEEFGLFVETGAETGARPSQLARLEVQDVQASRSDPQLMMPVSRKGRGQKNATHRPVPISAALAKRLAASVSGRPSRAPLLVKPSGEPWRKSDHSRLFARAAKAAGQDSAQVTIHALRHCSIVRQLVAGVPVRIVAFNHDTSVAIIERICSRYIGDRAI